MTVDTRSSLTTAPSIGVMSKAMMSCEDPIVMNEGNFQVWEVGLDLSSDIQGYRSKSEQ